MLYKNQLAFNRIEEYFLFFVAFFISFTINFANGFETTRLNDAKDYLNQARRIPLGIDYIFANPEVFSHNLPFAYLVSLTFSLGENNSLIVFKLALMLVFAFSALIFNKILMVFIKNTPIRRTAILLFIFNPFLLISTIDVQTESFVTLIVLCWFKIILRKHTLGSTSSLEVFMFFFLGVFSIVFRPNMFFVFVALAVYFYLQTKDQLLLKPFFVSSSIAFMALLFLYEVFLFKLNDGFVFLANYGGIGVEYACRPELLQQYLGIADKTTNNELNVWFNQMSNTDNAAKDASLAAINSSSFKNGVDFCLENPVVGLGIMLAKLYAILRPYTNPGSYGVSITVLSFILWAPCLFFMTQTFLAKKKSHNEKVLLAYYGILFLSFLPSLLLTINHTRHRVSFSEPFWILFLAIGLQRLFAKVSLNLLHQGSKPTIERIPDPDGK
jgi:hypothetical protein